MNRVPSWSHSKDTDFRKCARMFWLKHGEKIPEPPRPLPPGKTEHANDRGTRIHNELESYVNGTSDSLPLEAEKHFGPQVDLLRVLHAEGLVSLEGEWAMDEGWEPAPWKDGWLRLKLDAIVFVSETEAVVIDYKSGKKWGNEIKHAEQLQLYQLVAFLRYPKLEKVTAELWYVDQPKDNITSLKFTRRQGLRFKEVWTKRGKAITTATSFPPRPNKFSCEWCPYGPWEGGTGHCDVGVKA